jgi:tetratricopeptide (TPR) repeat protein
LEERFPEIIIAQPELLAYHFSMSEAWDRAFAYLVQSGDKARQVYANQEAITFYTQAVEASGRITPALDATQLLPLYEGRRLVWMLLHKMDESIADFRTMLQLARTCGNQHKEGEGLCHLSFSHYQKMSGDQISLVEQYAQEAMQLAQQTGDQEILALSLIRLENLDRDRGNLRDADSKLEQVLHISRREGFNDSVVQSLAFLGSHAYWQGKFVHAVQMCQEGVTLAHDVHNGYYELFDLANLCLACWSAGNYAQALMVLDEGTTKAQERKSMFIVGRLTNTLGWFYRELGDITRAVKYVQESVELGRSFHIHNVEISALINLGLDYLALGHHDRSLYSGTNSRMC